MATFTRVNGKMAKPTDKASSLTLMGQCTKASGSTMFIMVKAAKPGTTTLLNMLETSRRVKRQAKVDSSMITIRMRATSLKDSSTVKEFITLLTVARHMRVNLRITTFMVEER